jgi:hypothetical protein
LRLPAGGDGHRCQQGSDYEGVFHRATGRLSRPAETWAMSAPRLSGSRTRQLFRLGRNVIKHTGRHAASEGPQASNVAPISLFVVPRPQLACFARRERTGHRPVPTKLDRYSHHRDATRGLC